MARASGREKSESGPAGRLFPAAFLRRPALGDGGPPASGTVVLVPRPAELLALVSPAVLASGTVRRSATSRSESGATARPGMRAMRSPLHRDPSTQVFTGGEKQRTRRREVRLNTISVLTPTVCGPPPTVSTMLLPPVVHRIWIASGSAITHQYASARRHPSPALQPSVLRLSTRRTGGQLVPRRRPRRVARLRSLRAAAGPCRRPRPRPAALLRCCSAGRAAQARCSAAPGQG